MKKCKSIIKKKYENMINVFTGIFTMNMDILKNLEWDKFTFQMNFRQSRFSYGASGTFTNNK